MYPLCAHLLIQFNEKKQKNIDTAFFVTPPLGYMNVFKETIMKVYNGYLDQLLDDVKNVKFISGQSEDGGDMNK